MNLAASLSSAGDWLLRASWQAGVLAILILAVQWLAGSRLSARWRYNLWLLVVLRLLLPAVPSSQLSVHNLIALPSKSAPPPPLKIEQPVDANLSVVVLEDEPFPVQTPLRPITPIAPAKSWREYAIPAAWLLWLCGFLVLFLRTLIATVKLAMHSRRFAPVTDSKTLELLDQARRAMRIRRRITLLSAPNLTTPALMGLIHPRILLPTRVLGEFHPSELRLIFLHELAHLRRCDVAVNWLITLLNMLHWFNPLLWIAFARLRGERELACDELVLQASAPNERREYGNTMIKLLQAFSRGSALPGVVGILEGQAPLRRRITMIAQFDGKQHRTWMALLAAIILAMVCLTDAAVGQQRGNGPRRGGGIGVPGETASPQPQPPPPAGFFGGGGEGGPAVIVAHFANVEKDTDADAASAQTRSALMRKVPEVKFDQVALADVMSFMQDITTLNIYVDWKAMEAAGIERNVTISLQLKNVPAGEVLRLVLREASPSLRYDIESGIVVISPNPRQPVALIKAYNVEDLTIDNSVQMKRSWEMLEERIKNAPDETQREQLRSQLGEMQGQMEFRRSARIQELVALIQSAVAPYTTSGMTVKAFDTKLIVTADDSGHQEVAKVLDMLRDKSDGPAGERKADPKSAPKPGGATRP
jgi:beta-lactamase regulating signal transducer with metallopeptidase domain